MAIDSWAKLLKAMQQDKADENVVPNLVGGSSTGLDEAAAELRARDQPQNDGLTRLAEQVEQTAGLVRQIIANSENSIHVLTTDGRVLSVNATSKRLRDDAGEMTVLGDLWVEWWDEEFREIAEETLDKACREGSGRFFATATQAGELRWWDTVVTLLNGEGMQPEHLLANSRDITPLKIAEAALAEKEQNLRLLLESINDYAIFTLDLNGIVTSWNSGAEKSFRYAPSEILGRDGNCLWTVEDQLRGGAAQEMAEAIEKGWAADERWHLRKDGGQFFASGTLNAIYGPTGEVTGFTKICRDVTEQMRVSTEAAALRTRVDAALIAGEIGTWVWEIDEDRVYADRNLAKFFMVSEEDASGGPVARYLSAIHEDDIERVRQTIGSALESGAEFESDYRLHSSNGLRWVTARGRIERDAEGKAIRLPGVVLDITERKRAEADLQTVSERLGLAIEAAELGTFYCPVPFREIVWNDKCKEHFWLPPEAEVDIDRFYSILHVDDRERTRDAIDQSILKKEGYDIEYRTVSPVGRIRWVRAMGRGFYDAEGNPTRFDGITIDVSDKKSSETQLEEALEAERAARAESERSSRLKDDFLATLSHELRTPLNAILGWAQVLRTSARSPEDIEQGLTTIERNARAQTQIIEDLLEMSRIISGKIRLDVQKLNLGSVVEAAVETVRPSAMSKGIELISIVDPKAKSMTGDPNRLQQVFWNLLSNAIKFTPRGGKVRITLQRINSHVEVSVVDNGEGMEPDFVPHIFDRFRQADGSSTRRHGGLGLGLAIVKQLVELHGGSIGASSPGVGKGSAFTVSLPWSALSHDSGIEDSERHPVSAFAPLSNLTLSLRLDGITAVVLDDEKEARALVARLLEDCGAAVLVAESVGEALAMVESHRPDILISDIGMPGEDGYSLIKRVRKLPSDRGGETPAIALTAYARAEDRMKAVLAGFQMHVSKPVEGAELLAMVGSLTRRTS